MFERKYDAAFAEIDALSKFLDTAGKKLDCIKLDFDACLRESERQSARSAIDAPVRLCSPTTASGRKTRSAGPSPRAKPTRRKSKVSTTSTNITVDENKTYPTPVTSPPRRCSPEPENVRFTAERQSPQRRLTFVVDEPVVPTVTVAYESTPSPQPPVIHARQDVASQTTVETRDVEVCVEEPKEEPPPPPPLPKTSRLIVQHMPPVAIRKPLVVQKVHTIEIIAADASPPFAPSANGDNVGYYELTSVHAPRPVAVSIGTATEEAIASTVKNIDKNDAKEMSSVLKTTVHDEMKIVTDEVPSISTLKAIQRFLEEKRAMMDANFSQGLPSAPTPTSLKRKRIPLPSVSPSPIENLPKQDQSPRWEGRVRSSAQQYLTSSTLLLEKMRNLSFERESNSERGTPTPPPQKEICSDKQIPHESNVVSSIDLSMTETSSSHHQSMPLQKNSSLFPSADIKSPSANQEEPSVEEYSDDFCASENSISKSLKSKSATQKLSSTRKSSPSKSPMRKTSPTPESSSSKSPTAKSPILKSLIPKSPPSTPKTSPVSFRDHSVQTRTVRFSSTTEQHSIGTTLQTGDSACQTEAVPAPKPHFDRTRILSKRIEVCAFRFDQEKENKSVGTSPRQTPTLCAGEDAIPMKEVAIQVDNGNTPRRIHFVSPPCEMVPQIPPKKGACHEIDPACPCDETCPGPLIPTPAAANVVTTAPVFVSYHDLDNYVIGRPPSSPLCRSPVEDISTVVDESSVSASEGQVGTVGGVCNCDVSIGQVHVCDPHYDIESAIGEAVHIDSVCDSLYADRFTRVRFTRMRSPPYYFSSTDDGCSTTTS